MKLIWKELVNFNDVILNAKLKGRYLISENGDIFDNKTRRNRECKPEPDGRVRMLFGDANYNKYLRVYRLTALHFCTGWFEGAIIDHLDGNPGNNHYTNLKWDTYKGNSNNPIALENNRIASKLKWANATPEKRKAYCDAISAGKKGKLPKFKDGIHPRLGATHTEEARAKISAANLERYSGKDMILTSTDLDGNKLHYRTWIEAWEQAPDSKRSIRESRNTGLPTKNGLIWTPYQP